MSAWKTTRTLYVRVNGVWINNGAVEAIDLTVSGKARVHLAGGATVDVPLKEGQDVDHVAHSLWKREAI